MITLYQRENCPFCGKVRSELERLGLDVHLVNVKKLGSERDQLLALEGIDSPTVPVLVDGERVIQDADEIVSYLRERYKNSFFGDPAYGLTRVLDNVGFSDAVALVRSALGEEGFGVLTEIDVKATLKKKIGADFRNYVILGACNPPLAHQALTAEPGIGLLLPCNVVVTEEDDGRAVVSAADPTRLFSIIDRPDIKPMAEDIAARLKRVLAAL